MMSHSSLRPCSFFLNIFSFYFLDRIISFDLSSSSLSLLPSQICCWPPLSKFFILHGFPEHLWYVKSLYSVQSLVNTYAVFQGCEEGYQVLLWLPHFLVVLVKILSRSLSAACCSQNGNLRLAELLAFPGSLPSSSLLLLTTLLSTGFSPSTPNQKRPLQK